MPRALAVVFPVTAVAIVVIVSLWVFPGYLATTCPTHATLGVRTYCAESVTLVERVPCFGGLYCSDHRPSFSFHGVEFQLLLLNFSGAYAVSGSVTEANNTSYAVYLLGDPLGPPSVNWSSPDQVVLVDWRAPYGTLGSDHVLQTNVTCGVSFAVIS